MIRVSSINPVPTASFLLFPADGECLQLLRDKDVVGVVVKLMEELPTHYVLQEVNCDGPTLAMPRAPNSVTV